MSNRRQYPAAQSTAQQPHLQQHTFPGTTPVQQYGQNPSQPYSGQPNSQPYSGQPNSQPYSGQPAPQSYSSQQLNPPVSSGQPVVTAQQPPYSLGSYQPTVQQSQQTSGTAYPARNPATQPSTFKGQGVAHSPGAVNQGFAPGSGNAPQPTTYTQPPSNPPAVSSSFQSLQQTGQQQAQASRYPQTPHFAPQQPQFSQQPQVSSTPSQTTQQAPTGLANQMQQLSVQPPTFPPSNQPNMYAGQNSQTLTQPAQPQSRYAIPQQQVAPQVQGVQTPGNRYGNAPSMYAQQGQAMQQHSQMQPPGIQPQMKQDRFVEPDLTKQCPRTYVTPTLRACPDAPSLSSKIGFPLGCVLHPLADPKTPEEQIPLVTNTGTSSGSSSILRCKKCRTYINPFVTLLENNQKWRCNMCWTINNDGKHMDISQKPELSRGCVEFVAPSDYMVRPPMPPVYVFLIEATFASVSSGVLDCVAATLQSTLDNLAGGSRTKVAFITFNGAVHFYNLKSTLSQPQMLVVPEINDCFIPQPEDLLVNLHDSKAVVKSFVEKLPSMFAGTRNVEACTGTALRAAFSIMKNLGGKLMLFTSSLTNAGLARLKDRTKSTDKEVALLKSQDDFYRNFGLDCSRVHICVDVFSFGARYNDLASFGIMSQITSGEVFHYSLGDLSSTTNAGNQPSLTAHHANKLRYDLWHNLLRTTGWEAVMRVRVSKGLKITKHHGHGFVRNQDLLALPSINCDQGFGVQLQLEESLTSTHMTCLQAALLYTTSSGERRIRVMTTALGVTSQLSTLFSHVDVEATLTLMGQMAIQRALTSKLGDAREAILNKCVEVFRVYRFNVVGQQPQLQGTYSQEGVIFPPGLENFARYCMAMIKHSSLRFDKAIGLDQRMAAMMSMQHRPLCNFVPFVYPRFFRVDNMPPEAGTESVNGVVLPQAIELSSEYLAQDGLFLLDNADDMFLWCGKAVSPNLLSSVFGVSSIHEIDQTKTQLPALDNDLSKRLSNIINSLRSKSSRWQRLFIVKDGGHPLLHRLFLTCLIQDRSESLNASYVEFLREVNRLMNSK